MMPRPVIVPAGLALAAAMVFTLLLAGRPALAAEAPDSLAGIRLGATVEEQAAKLVPTEANKTFHRPALGIMPVAALKGFRSGYVDYGMCAAKGRVVRRLAAVLALTPQELLEAEVKPELLEAKVKEQALRPFAETFQEVLGFFSGLAQPPGSSPVSSGTGRAGEEVSPEAAAPGAPSPSGDS